MQPTDHDQIVAFAERFTASRPLSPVSGSQFGLGEAVVFHTAVQPLPEKGRVEVNRIAPDAPPSFEWVLEVTIDNRAGGQFIHFIARRDGSLVETYGKNVIPIDHARTTSLLKLLTDLTG